MKCPRCLNEDDSYFYKGSKGTYCRRCISYSRVMLEESITPVKVTGFREDAFEYSLPYSLSKAQKKVAHEAATAVVQQDVLIHAVCGSGKTEMVLESIYQALCKKQSVCFAISRRQVVLEISKRLSGLFFNAKVVPVCQGYTEDLYGDIVVCTTHQLYRYYNAFDLLILDEPDAFPFKGDAVLHGIAKTACRGHCIYLTATPDEELKKRIAENTLTCFKLNRRPHGYDLPVPQLKMQELPMQWISLIRWLKENESHPCMVFVPTISMAKQLGFLLSLWKPTCTITSKTENKDAIIDAYRKGTYNIMVTTTVMERGVTIENVSVAVLCANHSVFDEASLTQIAGRAGRTFSYPKGNVLFLCNEKSETVDRCIQHIREANVCAA